MSKYQILLNVMADTLSPSPFELRLRQAVATVILDEMGLDWIIFNRTQERDIIEHRPQKFLV